MPCVTLHSLIHLIPADYQKERYPAIHTILYSQPDEPEHYTLTQMMFWASLPYAVWQLAYHLLISVRRKDKIRAGRPTSFTWLRKSYSSMWIGRIVLSLPEVLQEPAYMLIQYSYALMTMIPCPLWFWSKWASGIFLGAVFAWSVWNGATYYIDVFGNRFQKELEALKKDVAKWQSAAEAAQGEALASPPISPYETMAMGTGKSMKEPAKPMSAFSEDDSRDAVNRIPGVGGNLGPEKLRSGDTPVLEAKKEI